MPCIRSVECNLNRLHIPHLSDKDNVGIFPQCGTKRRSKTVGILTDTALIDDTFTIFMDELDRIFNRYICLRRFQFISLINAAKVVDLPLPVTPVTRTSPRSISAKL